MLKNKQLKIATPALLAGSFILTLFLMLQPVAHATELSPADNIKPPKSEPSMNNLPKRTTLTMEAKELQQGAVQINKSKPSWWKWLTNTSNKPASYHYIDIIELLE